MAPSGSAPTATGSTACLPEPAAWEAIRHDTTATSISWDFVQAIAFGARGQIWYGTIGNGWGLSTDGGATWKNWTYKQLGPEWQYVAPSGIAVRGDTTMIGTADGVQVTTNDGAKWTALGDGVGPPAQGPADTVYPGAPQRVRAAGGAQSAGAGTSPLSGAASGFAAAATGWEGEPLTARRVPSGQRAADRARSSSRAPRAASAQQPTPCPASGSRAPPPNAPRRAAHHLVPATHRADRQQLHRPDLPLRLDHGRQLPAAPGRGVQQPGWHAGLRHRLGHGGVRRAGGSRGRSPSPSGTTPR